MGSNHLANRNRLPLNELLGLFDISTLQHAAQITTDRHTDETIRDMCFLTADSLLWEVKEDGDIILYAGDVSTNLIFRHAADAMQQLGEGLYRPSQDEAAEVIRSAEDGLVTRVNISNLGRKGMIRDHSKKTGYLELEPREDYDDLDPDERVLVQKLIGEGDRFQENMQMIAEAGKRRLSISMHGLDYLREVVGPGNAVATLCYLQHMMEHVPDCSIGMNHYLHDQHFVDSGHTKDASAQVYGGPKFVCHLRGMLKQ